MTLVLASSSPTRRRLLENAGVPIDVVAPKVDEDSLRAALRADGITPRDMADALAEMKALKVSEKMPGRLVLGADQILDHDGEALRKAVDRLALAAQLGELQGKKHRLWSAAVLCEDGRPVWRHIGQAQMTMRPLTESQINTYLESAWPDVAGSVGGYKVEGLGARLFQRLDGDYFSILGLPLIEILNHLILRDMITP